MKYGSDYRDHVTTICAKLTVAEIDINSYPSVNLNFAPVFIYRYFVLEDLKNGFKQI